MASIIIVEDIYDNAVKATAAIINTGLVQPGDIETWLIQTPAEYKKYLDMAETTEARVMLADLKLISSLNDQEQAMIEIAQNAAPYTRRTEDDWLWNWTDFESTSISTGFLVVSRFLEKNPDRKSVLVASTHGHQVRKALEARAPRFHSTTYALGDPAVLRDDLPKFLRLALGSWEDTLWANDTASWFKRLESNDASSARTDPMRAHEPRVELLDIYKQQKERVRQLLARLFGYNAPDHWFNEDEFYPLFKSLQCLTGHYSCANGSSPEYNLCLLNLPILLGIAGAQVPEGSTLLKDVLSQVSFHEFRFPDGNNPRIQILPLQSPEASRTSIRQLVASLKSLVKHKHTNQLTVKKLSLTSRFCQIDFEFGNDHVQKFVEAGAAKAGTMFAWVNTSFAMQDWPEGFGSLNPQMWIDVFPMDPGSIVSLRFCVRPSDIA
jgi:hypothetical protein